MKIVAVHFVTVHSFIVCVDLKKKDMVQLVAVGDNPSDNGL